MQPLRRGSQQRKLVALQQHRLGQQRMQRVQQDSPQQLSQQQLELHLCKQGGHLKRQGQLQHRQSGQKVAVLQMHRQLLGRLQVQLLQSKEAHQPK